MMPYFPSRGLTTLRFWFTFAPFSLLGGAGCLGAVANLEGAPEEVTIAESIDVQAWTSDAVGVREQVLGAWTHPSLQSFEIHPFPFAENTVLVSLPLRMVPGFLTMVEGEPFLVVGDLASAELELMPRVFQIVHHEDRGLVSLVEIVTGDSRETHANPESLKQWLQREVPAASRMTYERFSSS